MFFLTTTFYSPCILSLLCTRNKFMSERIMSLSIPRQKYRVATALESGFVDYSTTLRLKIDGISSLFNHISLNVPKYNQKTRCQACKNWILLPLPQNPFSSLITKGPQVVGQTEISLFAALYTTLRRYRWMRTRMNI
jgi:hypothetical protein